MYVHVFGFHIWFQDWYACILTYTFVPGCLGLYLTELLVDTCIFASVSQTLHAFEQVSFSVPCLLLGIGVKMLLHVGAINTKVT